MKEAYRILLAAAATAIAARQPLRHCLVDEDVIPSQVPAPSLANLGR
jgi:hypothetical protein